MIVACGYALAVVANLLTLMFEPHPACAKCATNVIFVADRPAVGRAVDIAANIVAAMLIAAVVVAARRAVPRRDAGRRGACFRPIGLTGGAALAFLAAGFAAGPIDQGVKNVLVTIALIALATRSVLVPRRACSGAASHAAASRSSCSTCARPPASRRRRTALRRALNDPGVMLAAWVEERHGYVDPDGRAFEVPTDDVDRIATMIASETGEPSPSSSTTARCSTSRSCSRRSALPRGSPCTATAFRPSSARRLDELQRERDFMRDVVNAAPAFFCVLDLDGRIIRFNDTMARAMRDQGRRRERQRAGPLRLGASSAVPEDAEAFRESVLANASGEQQHHFRAAGGGAIDVAWSLTPVNDSQGVLRLVLTGADVSERVRHAEELRRERDFLDLVGALDARRSSASSTRTASSPSAA